MAAVNFNDGLHLEDVRKVPCTYAAVSRQSWLPAQKQETLPNQKVMGNVTRTAPRQRGCELEKILFDIFELQVFLTRPVLNNRAFFCPLTT